MADGIRKFSFYDLWVWRLQYSDPEKHSAPTANHQLGRSYRVMALS